MFRRSARRGAGKVEDIEYLMRNESTEALLALARSYLTRHKGEEGLDTAERILAEVRDRYRGHRRRP